jgi:hypothetical protein
MADVKELGAKAIDALGLPPELAKVIKDIQADLAEDYRASFVAMVEALSKQASAIDRIQTTLNILVKAVAPQVAGSLPAAIQLVGDGKDPDLATALVVADPIGAGYTLSQKALAQALGLQQAYVSVLVRAFNLPDDGKCAVKVRKGGAREMVNYHPRAVDRFLALVANPPKTLDKSQQSALERVRVILLKGAKSATPSGT